MKPMINLFKFPTSLRVRSKKGSPILEEILLIGIAVFIFAIIFGVIYSLINWSTGSIGDLFS
ncbi:MAG: hypothetical protein ACTSSG_04495 [Candidatus Heimdallarchaeaceae archaeon]